MDDSKKYDVVIFGATGFTGKLVVEYALSKYLGSDISWAIAGRSDKKLNGLKEKLQIPESVGIINVDGNDESSVHDLVNQTKCVLTTVGPYQLYGEKIIRACISSGTDYVDLCGEPAWMHKIISEYSNDAKSSGSRIVFSCGFDSIPFDLGVLFLQEKVKSKINKYTKEVSSRIRTMDGEFSGGTAASMKATISSLKTNPELLNVLINPYALCDGIEGIKQKDDSKVQYDENLQTWIAPFFMAPINTKNIHRTNKLMNHIYGKDFLYNEMWVQGSGEEGKAAAKDISSTNPLSNAPEPGEGPSRYKREKGSYDILFYTKVDGHIFKVSVSGDMDPGYGSTSKMIFESALCLVTESKDLTGGIYTPAASMGFKLMNRLEKNAGLTFKVE